MSNAPKRKVTDRPSPNSRPAPDDFVSGFTDLVLVVDGVRIRHPADFRVQSRLFHFTSVADNPFGIPSAVRTPSVSDGYWAQIGPIPRRNSHGVVRRVVSSVRLLDAGRLHPDGPTGTLVVRNDCGTTGLDPSHRSAENAHPVARIDAAVTSPMPSLSGQYRHRGDGESRAPGQWPHRHAWRHIAKHSLTRQGPLTTLSGIDSPAAR